MTSVAMSRARPRRSQISGSWLLTTTIPVALFTLFAIGHVANWHKTGHLTGAMLVGQELVFVALFVVRRRPTESSSRPLHWFVAMAGSFTTLLLRPSLAPSRMVGDVAFALQALGAVAAIACLTGLGRSFGIVAADRGLKVGGPYRIIRHPIYTSYLIGWTGYVLGSPTLRNLVVLVVSLVFQLWRITDEERLLNRDGAYRAYAERVRYRLIPWVF